MGTSHRMSAMSDATALASNGPGKSHCVSTLSDTTGLLGKEPTSKHPVIASHTGTPCVQSSFLWQRWQEGAGRTVPRPFQEPPLLCTLCTLGSSAAPSPASLRALSLSSSGVPSWIVSGLPASVRAFAFAPPCAVQSAGKVPHNPLHVDTLPHQFARCISQAMSDIHTPGLIVWR